MALVTICINTTSRLAATQFHCQVLKHSSISLSFIHTVHQVLKHPAERYLGAVSEDNSPNHTYVIIEA